MPLRLAIALALGLHLGALQVSDGANTQAFAGSAPAEAPSLLTRRPIGFDAATFTHLRSALDDAPEQALRLAAKIHARGRALGPWSSASLVALLGIVVATAVAQFRLGPRVEERLSAGIDAVGWTSRTGRAWLLALGQVVARTAPPLVLLALHGALTELTGFRGAGFALLGRILLAWSALAASATVLHEFVRRPLLPVAALHGRYLWGVGFGGIVYTALVWSSLEAARAIGMRSDVLALLRFVADLAFLLALTTFAARKEAILSVLPDLPYRPWQIAVRGLSAVYAPVVVFTAGLGLLSLCGFEQLAHFLWVRSWAMAALFAGTVLALHAAHRLVHRATGAPAQPGVARHRLDPASRLDRSAIHLIDALAILVATGWAIELVEVREPLVTLLTQPGFTLADRRVSPLMLCETALVVGAVFLASRLLRDLLAVRVYPALELDDALARAIDTFVGWASIGLGLVFAAEWVGLGVGAITVFAGALGIGLGFGMQALAANVASGLLLIFERALRRGDWVAVGGTVGVIEDVGMRATRVRTPDEIDVLVPNTELVTHPIVNWTGTTPLVREHVPVKVAVSVDPEYVRDVLLAVARATPGVEQEPAPEVLLTGLTDATLELELLPWIDLKRHSRAHVRSELYFGVLSAFRRAGIEVPQPQREVHVRSVHPLALEEAWKLASIDPVRERARRG